MANRVLINDLPKYPVCTISELVNGSPSQHSQPHQDHINRRIVKLPNGREILVVLHPITNEVFAMDRFCYHHGYPLENGDIEDIAAFETMNDNSTKKDESNEIAKNNARRGEGQVIPRQKGPLKFNKEEHLKAMSKSLQSQQNTAAATNSATKEETSPSTSNDVDYKSIQPGQLEVDFEDPSKFQSDDSAYFPIITCTLHNRIFDFRTGDMISRSVVRKTVNKDGKEVPEDDEAAAGEQKCLISESTGCHQRIHPISIERENNNNENVNDNSNHDGVIFFHDTFGYSVPMRRPGSKVNMEDRSHLMFLAKKKVLSDKENKEINVKKV